MKVFITGGCGFLGSHACEHFKTLGWDVIAYDNMTKYELSRTGYTEGARDFNRKFLEGIGVEVIVGDVTDYEFMLKSAIGCDYIIHTAAQPAMTISWENPELDLNTNIVGTFNVLKVARKLNIPVVSCATIHTYGNDSNFQLDEGKTSYSRPPTSETAGMMGGKITPLHVSKYTGDAYVRCFIDTYGLQAASFRLTGIYGTRQFGAEDHGWVANFVIKSVTKKPITIFGTGKQARDIIYATDVCKAFERFYVTRKSGVYNIGGGVGTLTSLIECVEIIRDYGYDPKVIYENERHGDLKFFCCDIKKAEGMGWSPTITPKDGIKKLIDWAEENKRLF